MPEVFSVGDGVCHGIEYLCWSVERISTKMLHEMKDRLELFASPMAIVAGGYYWGDGGAREERAFACGLLAAMTEPDHNQRPPQRRNP